METSKPFDGATLFDLTSFAGDTPASRSAPQANAKVRTTPDTCGLGCETPLANYDPDTQSWKMYGDTSLWGEARLLENLPPSGMTQNGVLFPQPAWAPIIDVIGSSLWPTPVSSAAAAEDLGTIAARLHNGAPYKSRLQEAVALQTWPTPVASDAWTDNLTSSQIVEGSRHSLTLGKAVQMWPTPTASSWGNEGSRAMLDRRIADGSITEQDKRAMTAGNGGKLNPTWVEWLMGFPTGWTDLED